MNRRNALKGLGLTFGYMVATPTVVSILQSCKNDASTAIWTPEFFTVDEGIVVENLVDLMIPKTNGIPGASDVNVAKFLDLFGAKAITKEEQARYREGLAAVVKALNQPVDKLTTNDYDALLAKYLKADKEQLVAFEENPEDLLVLGTLRNLRGSAIWAYRTSQMVGEGVLVYDPIPGKYESCISVEEATGGRAWSL